MGGEWPDIGVHTPEGSVRLGNGCFAIRHPMLRSIDAPGAGSSLSVKDTEAFWSQHKAWGFGGDARSKGQDPNGKKGGQRDSRNESEASRAGARRWNKAIGA